MVMKLIQTAPTELVPSSPARQNKPLPRTDDRLEKTRSLPSKGVIMTTGDVSLVENLEPPDCFRRLTGGKQQKRLCSTETQRLTQALVGPRRSQRRSYARGH